MRYCSHAALTLKSRGEQLTSFVSRLDLNVEIVICYIAKQNKTKQNKTRANFETDMLRFQQQRQATLDCTLRGSARLHRHNFESYTVSGASGIMLA